MRAIHAGRQIPYFFKLIVNYYLNNYDNSLKNIALTNWGWHAYLDLQYNINAKTKAELYV